VVDVGIMEARLEKYVKLPEVVPLRQTLRKS